MSALAATPLLPPTAHALHAYFDACPESPDGRLVALFVSARPDAHVGDICVVERATGETRVLAEGVEVEDAHRQAYQQWACGGECLVYQELRAGRWRVCAIDLATGERRELCADRQLAWGRPGLDVVPLHGPHWAPGAHRDLELLDLRSGRIEVALTVEEVAATQEAWVRARFGDRPLSIFFPTLSPDGRRVIFKLAAPKSGVFRDPHASDRHGLFAWDLAQRRPLYFREGWGHPAWHPDSRHVFTPPDALIDVIAGSESAIAGLEPLRGAHPGFTSDGRRLVTDFLAEDGRWGLAVTDLAAPGWRTVYLPPAPGAGTTSWRPPHPHPAVSADGRRVYFNANLGPWCVCHVAELPEG